MRLVILLLLALPLPAMAADIDITWQAPTENVDGSPLTDLAGYNVYIGTASRTYTQTVAIADSTLTTATVAVTLTLQPGDNDVYVAMTALDAAGNESAYSNEVLKVVNVVDDIAPNAPVIITITISIGVDCPAGFSCTVN